MLIYPQRSREGKIDPAYEVLIKSEQVKRIYLEDLPETQPDSWGLKIFKLMIESERSTAQKAQEILREIKRETFPVSSASIEELVETIIVYKFPQLSRLESLGEALLDFTTRSNLTQWLETNP